MKDFAVYGRDTTKAVAMFDTINEAIEYARKVVRNNCYGRTIKSLKYREVYYRVWKTNGKVNVQRHIIEKA